MTNTIDYNEMLQISREIAETTLQLKKAMTDTENLVLSLSAIWQGDSATAYGAQIIGLKHQCADIVKFTADVADVVQSFAEKYRDFDYALKTEFDKI